jgi:hypothetical protein
VTMLMVVTKILLIRPAKLVIQRARPRMLLVLTLRSTRRPELGGVSLHWLVLADVAERGTVVAIVEGGASLQLNAAFISLDNFICGCPVQICRWLLCQIIINFLPVQIDGYRLDLPLPGWLRHQLNLGHIRLFLFNSERVCFCHF